MIELRQITKVYNAGKANEFKALHGIDLSIATNSVTVLTGPSGSGKTTLLSRDRLHGPADHRKDHD